MIAAWREAWASVAALVLDYWRMSRLLLAATGIAALSSALFAVMTPYLFSRLIDRLPAETEPYGVLAGFAVYVAFVAFGSIAADASSYLALVASKQLDYVVATRFFDRILAKTGAFFAQKNATEIYNALALGQDSVNEIVQFVVVSLAPGIVQITLSLALLGVALDAQIVAIVIVYGVFYVTLTHLANRRTRPALDNAIAAAQENARFVGDAVVSVETLRQLGSGAWLARRFEETSAQSRDRWIEYARRRVGYTIVQSLGLATELLATFWILWPRYRGGEITLGDVVLFNAVLLQLNHPFEMIGQGLNGLMRAMVQFEPFAQIWRAPHEPDAAGDGPALSGEGRLAFERVSYVHAGGRGVRELDFVAERGRLTFLVGETGSGKSTALRLALKALDPQDGTVRVDGVDLRDIPRKTWHGLIGVVPQEIALLNDSLTVNILVGRPRDEGRLREAARRAALLDFVEGLDDGFDTMVGERGLLFSGGERQRIAIARALYARPRFLFLDEASSALDEETEREVIGAIRALSHEMTVVAVTHRRAVIASDDRLVRLADGRRSKPHECSADAPASLDIDVSTANAARTP